MQTRSIVLQDYANTLIKTATQKQKEKLSPDETIYRLIFDNHNNK